MPPPRDSRHLRREAPSNVPFLPGPGPTLGSEAGPNAVKSGGTHINLHSYPRGKLAAIPGPLDKQRLARRTARG